MGKEPERHESDKKEEQPAFRGAQQTQAQSRAEAAEKKEEPRKGHPVAKVLGGAPDTGFDCEVTDGETTDRWSFVAADQEEAQKKALDEFRKKYEAKREA